MDYAFSRIHEAAEQVKDFRHDVASKSPTEFEFDATRADMAPDQLKKKVLQYLDNAIVTLRTAEVYARRAEWLQSGDDGYDDFISRTDEELDEVRNATKAMLEEPKPFVVNEMRDTLVQMMDALEARGYNPNETVDDWDPMYKAWNRAKEVLSGHPNGV